MRKTSWTALAILLLSLAVSSKLASQAPPDKTNSPAKQESPTDAKKLAKAKKPAKTNKLATPHDFLSVLLDETGVRRQALAKIDRTWRSSYAVMVVELLPFAREPETREQLLITLRRHTGQRIGLDLKAWYQWIWSQSPSDHPQYAEFKSLLYGHIDPVFRGYFEAERTSKIRLDEVRWGGVQQDGIPPLRNPKMISPSQASYLEDSNVVFGIEVQGEARAYPKRILAWHEMFTDTIAGVSVAGVYCTLCGTVILYETELDGQRYELGTSGFLYRSNKLMYDRATQSLWNTLWGKPVIGPLADQDIQLRRGSVVTTTWGEWRRRHPETQVLSLETGHRRDYSEGTAYREYFATDDLMFNVPKLDKRLKNKQEVLTFVPRNSQEETLAISADFLAQNPLHHDQLGELDLVVLTDPSGANRAYGTKGHRFASWDGDHTAVDEEGKSWTLSESHLRSEDGQTLERLAAQRAFWFGWVAAYPETRLVK
ncbi:MAG: DUF3179 domain-containing protein [Deltaproteobacteria bacterium]|nr:DUF3179 domain-containing protein [Deltaproteobacteria bacterium]